MVFDRENHRRFPFIWVQLPLPRWAHQISAQIEQLRKEIRRMTDDQSHLDSDVQALTAGLDSVEAEIAALKNQPAAQSLDFAALDAAVARIQGDVPAPAPAPAPAPDENPTV